MVKLAKEIDESARESENCGFHVKRVLTRDAVALDEEKGEIIIVELRSVHQFNDSMDNFVMRAAPSEKDSTSIALKWPDDDPTQSRVRRGSPFKEMREAGVQRWGPRRTLRSCFQPSDKSHGDERGRRVFLRRVPQEDSLPRQ